MTLAQIKSAVEAGKSVHWSHDGYSVIKDKLDRFLIVCHRNDAAWGLTWTDGVTMNESESNFYIKGE
jgi:hypothetical protein